MGSPASQSSQPAGLLATLELNGFRHDNLQLTHLLGYRTSNNIEVAQF
jgi:hypothetical protein